MSNLTFAILVVCAVIIGLIINFTCGDYFEKHKTFSKWFRYMGFSLMGIGLILMVAGYILDK